mmetsp:Transcript_47342/g.143983  ORF Transcript_47342/g.143983 Transcript_47342/m.143983 type:complete len:221 (-) Transcript_47342:361-1023(-)
MTRPGGFALSMRRRSTSRSGLWSIVKSSVSHLPPARLCLQKAARASPTWATVSLFFARSRYAIVHVVPESPHVVRGKLLMICSWHSENAARSAASGSARRAGCARKLRTMFTRANCETSWPLGPCPSYTPMRMKVSSTAKMEKLSWFGESGFMPFLQAQANPSSDNHWTDVSSSCPGGHVTSPSFSLKLALRPPAVSVLEHSDTARFEPRFCLLNTPVSP